MATCPNCGRYTQNPNDPCDEKPDKSPGFSDRYAASILAMLAAVVEETANLKDAPPLMRRAAGARMRWLANEAEPTVETIRAALARLHKLANELDPLEH